MNRIVRENYPVANLPEELQEELRGVREVRVVIEVAGDTVIETEQAPLDVEGRPFSRFRHLARDNFKSAEEVTAYVRSLRDEWDERDAFHEQLRNGS